MQASKACDLWGCLPGHSNQQGPSLQQQLEAAIRATVDLALSLKNQETQIFRDAEDAVEITAEPAALAETYWHLAQQPRNCWTHEIDLRPHNDVPWWNDNPNPQIDATSGGKGFAGPKT